MSDTIAALIANVHLSEESERAVWAMRGKVVKLREENEMLRDQLRSAGRSIRLLERDLSQAIRDARAMLLKND